MHYNEREIVQKYASNGLIFVMAAYRTGIFGFLDLGSDKPVPRNLALHGM